LIIDAMHITLALPGLWLATFLPRKARTRSIAMPIFPAMAKIAAQAIADFEASKTLARAREAVELVVAKHKVEQNVSPEIASDMGINSEKRRAVAPG
jgi:hypothetical protein